MKVTKQELRQVIKEEIEKELMEQTDGLSEAEQNRSWVESNGYTSGPETQTPAHGRACWAQAFKVCYKKNVHTLPSEETSKKCQRAAKEKCGAFDGAGPPVPKPPRVRRSGSRIRRLDRQVERRLKKLYDNVPVSDQKPGQGKAAHRIRSTMKLMKDLVAKKDYKNARSAYKRLAPKVKDMLKKHFPSRREISAKGRVRRPRSERLQHIKLMKNHCARQGKRYNRRKDVCV